MESPWRAALRWPVVAAEELFLAPWTVRRVRRSLTELPERIETLTTALAETTGMLGSSLPSVDERMAGVAGAVGRLEPAVTRLADDLTAFRAVLEPLVPELSRLVGGMDDRVEHMEAMVGELGEALLNVMGAIPGVRRALRDGRGRRQPAASGAAGPAAAPPAQPATSAAAGPPADTTREG